VALVSHTDNTAQNADPRSDVMKKRSAASAWRARLVRTRAPMEARVDGHLRGDEAEPPELLPPPGTECAGHTRGLQTNPETTEGDPGGTPTTVCGYRPAPPPVGDRAHDRGRAGARRRPGGQRPGRAVDGGGQGRPRSRGRPREHLRVVLGGRPVAGQRRARPPGAPARVALGHPPRQERHPRLHRAGQPAAPG
jgi:hypothetical protein